MREPQPLGTPPGPSWVAGVPGMAQAGRSGGREAPAGAKAFKATIAKKFKNPADRHSVRFYTHSFSSLLILNHSFGARWWHLISFQGVS